MSTQKVNSTDDNWVNSWELFFFFFCPVCKIIQRSNYRLSTSFIWHPGKAQICIFSRGKMFSGQPSLNHRLYCFRSGLTPFWGLSSRACAWHVTNCGIVILISPRQRSQVLVHQFEADKRNSADVKHNYLYCDNLLIDLLVYKCYKYKNSLWLLPFVLLITLYLQPCQNLGWVGFWFIALVRCMWDVCRLSRQMFLCCCGYYVNVK